jgi:hypothetical protein
MQKQKEAPMQKQKEAPMQCQCIFRQTAQTLEDRVAMHCVKILFCTEQCCSTRISHITHQLLT